MMNWKTSKLLLVSTLIGVFAHSAAVSGTVSASTCSLTHVNTAINSAASGDTVVVPPGQCIWTSTLIVPDNKKITLMGSGVDSTMIINSGSGPTVDLGRSGSRLTGFAFLFSGSGFGVNAYGNGWRVDHCRFESDAARVAVQARGTSSHPGPQGLVDNCTFKNMRVAVLGDASLLAHSLWAQSYNFGSEKAVYVEDCEFTRTIHGNSMDSNYGGSYVFRHNTVNDSTVEAHSLQGTHRASRTWEIYSNTFNQVSRSMWAPFFMRGGTGVVFNNVVTGTWTSPAIVLDNIRTFESAGEGGKCDGSSAWDGNAESNGYPCRDQIGRSTDAWLWTSGNPYPPQELAAAYFWNNTHSGNNLSVIIHNNTGVHIKAGRDFYNNTPKPGYTPLAYPHPLRAQDGSAPQAPEDLRIAP